MASAKAYDQPSLNASWAAFLEHVPTLLVIATLTFLLVRLAPGDFFGETTLIEMQPRPCTAPCVTPVKLLELTNMDLYRLYREDVKAYVLVLQNFNRELCRRLRGAAAFGVIALGLHPGGVVGVVDLLEANGARKRQRDRSEADADLTLVGLVVDDFGELRPRHAGCDALDVHQHRPSLLRRERHFE